MIDKLSLNQVGHHRLHNISFLFWLSEFSIPQINYLDMPDVGQALTVRISEPEIFSNRKNDMGCLPQESLRS